MGTVSKEALQRILVIRLGAMGDILRTLPAVRSIRKALPDASIWWACDDRWSQVLESHPDLDGILPFPRARLDALTGPVESFRKIGPVLAYRRQLRERKFTLSLDFHGNLRSGVVGRLAGAPLRVGFAGHQQKEGNRLLTNFHVPSRDRRMSRIDRNFLLAGSLGIPAPSSADAGLPLVPELDQAAEQVAAGLLPPGIGFAVISQGASLRQAYKRPPAGLLAAAAAELGNRGIGALVSWGPGEQDAAEKVVELSQGAAMALPAVDLPLLFHLIRRARLFIGGDSGPLHIACAVGTPVLGLYGPTDPEVNAPWVEPHETVFPAGRAYTGVKKIDRGLGGFQGLTREQVLNALGRLLERLE